MWRRFHFEESSLKKKITSKLIDKLIADSYEVEDLLDTYEEMTTEENANQPTQEIFNDVGEMIWSNKPTEFKREDTINEILK